MCFEMPLRMVSSQHVMIFDFCCINLSLFSVVVCWVCSGCFNCVQDACTCMTAALKPVYALSSACFVSDSGGKQQDGSHHRSHPWSNWGGGGLTSSVFFLLNELCVLCKACVKLYVWTIEHDCVLKPFEDSEMLRAQIGTSPLTLSLWHLFISMTSSSPWTYVM